MRTGRAVLMVLVAAVALAGCGSSAKSNGEASKPPRQVLADARAAAADASAVHVHGTVVSGGTPVGVDLHLDRGKGGKGTVTQSGFEIDLIRIGRTVYLRGSDTFYERTLGEAAAARLRGKWLRGSTASGKLSALVPLTDIDKLVRASTSNTDTLRNRGETTYQGRPVVAIEDAAEKSTLYVAARGKPYVVAIVGNGSGDSGALHFDDWDDAVHLDAPSDALSLSELGG
ncbi:MAG TPA: hypothetical protein VFJ77_04145 [Gaiellaceae bacterium]|nr:hypothetical protein [Gaiellaceae bacterium]